MTIQLMDGLGQAKSFTSTPNKTNVRQRVGIYPVRYGPCLFTQCYICYIEVVKVHSEEEEFVGVVEVVEVSDASLYQHQNS